jgi:hypothetical protein
MQLSKDWGATNFNDALEAAAGSARVTALKLLKEWGATSFDGALRVAAPHAGTVKLLTAWGGCGAELFLDAAYEDKVFIMKILRRKGEVDYNGALVYAARASRVNSVEALVRWGATTVYEALANMEPLESASEEEKIKIRKIRRILRTRGAELCDEAQAEQERLEKIALEERHATGRGS